MGQHPSNLAHLEKEIGSDQFPANEHYFGLVNFGNTCYCNSVLQALYFCKPFRDKVLQYKTQSKRTKETLLSCLSDLFHNISSQKKKVGIVAPKKFIARLKKENELFDNFMQQDAHEFLNYLLNSVADLLQAEKVEPAIGALRGSTGALRGSGGVAGSGNIHSVDNVSVRTTAQASSQTWVHDIFQGTLTNETRCLNCETVSSKDEDFLDLSVDVDANTSISHCLRVFSNTETLCSEHKYFCEVCHSKQEAQKRMRVKKVSL
jgi:ubiquitin carboxyl-terminal hydrolase 12/46